MATRDFSDTAMDGIIADYYSSIMNSQFDAEALDDFYEYYGFHYNGSSESAEAFKQKQEYYEGMVAALQGIFRDARQYDTDAAPSFQPLQENIESVSSIMASLRGSIGRGSPQGGLWRIPTEEFAAALAANSDALSAAVRNRFAMLDESGNLVYDWDEIERVLDKPSDEITPLEYYILSYLYSQMGEEDMERFLQRLAEPGGGFRGNQFDYTSPTNPTWGFDPAKVGELSKYLVLSYVARGLDVDADTLTRLSILGALPGLGGQQGPGLPTFGITGDVGAAYPPIDVTLNPDGSAAINYMFVGSVNTVSGAGFSHFAQPGSITLRVPEGESLNAHGKWIDMLRARQDEHDRLNAADAANIAIIAAGAGLSFLSIPQPFGGIVGVSLALVSIGLVLNELYENYLFNNEINDDYDDAELLADVGTRFGCGAVITTTTESATSYGVVLLPGSSTYDTINRINEAIASDPGITGVLGYPLELGAIAEHPEEASDFLDAFRRDHPDESKSIFGS
jgi:hypothetical protein